MLAVTVRPTAVVNSRGAKQTVENTLTLEFSRTPENVAVPAGSDTLFTISFVYGKAGDPDGYGALTDVAEAELITPVAGDNVNDWVATPYPDAQSPYLTLQPPEGQPIAGTGVQAVSSWHLTKIATSYQPGPTVMLIKYAGVPGYDDGVYPVVLDKLPHVVVNGVSVVPQPSYLHDGKASVTVKWEVDYATKLTLTQNFAPKDVTGLTSIPAVLTAQSTHFTLSADGPEADVDNSDYGSVTAIALPVINSFGGAPTEIYAGSASHDLELDLGGGHDRQGGAHQ